MNGNHQQLLQLTYIRFIILVGQSAAVLFALWHLHIDLNPWPMGSALMLLGLLNLMTYARLHSPWPVTQPELFSQLLADTIIYGFMLYHTGGGTNPFIFMLLIPLIITVTTLARPYIWFMALVSIAIYGSLLVYYVPISSIRSEHSISTQTFFNVHMVGMWLNFTLTVVVITYFVHAMTRTLAQHREHLITARESQVQSQQILALGTIAAGTAHELGTPLSTMDVVLHEMSLDPALNTEHQEDIALLQQQVGLCAAKLQDMARSVQEEYQSERTCLLTEFIDDVIEQWKIARPDVTYQLHLQDDLPPDLRSTTLLRQALLNLLNNAADANPINICITCRWDEKDIWIQIRDEGPGLPMEKVHQLGQPFITTKGRGLGIGLFLTSTTIAQLDGEVKLYNAEQQGTITEVRLSRRAVHG